MAASSQERPSLLNYVLKAHGGPERWSQIKSIDLIWNFSGWLLAVAILRQLGSGPDDKFMFTPERTWIERRDGSISVFRDNPRASFATHVRTAPWDDLHLTYFVGYALYNYLITPFCFTWPGFQTRELPEHEERGRRRRVLEFTYLDSFATHTKVQKFYFNDKFMLQRLDYVTDVAGGPWRITASTIRRSAESCFPC